MNQSTETFPARLIRYRWWIIGPVGLFFILAEFLDDFLKRVDFVNALEFSLLLVLLAGTGILLELLVRAMHQQKRSMKIIDYQHRISLELMEHDDWQELIDKLARIPAEIAPIRETCLFLFNPQTSQFEAMGRWRDVSQVPSGMSVEEICDTCRMQGAGSGTCTRCSGVPVTSAVEQDLPNCIPLVYGISQLAMIRYALMPGESLSQDQQDILREISNEMAIALKSAQDRKQLAEIRQAEAGRAERRKVKHFLHDHLSQNLGYLRMKLDQLVMEQGKTAPDVLHNDLARLLSVANQSFDLVHGTLEMINPDAKSNLSQLLKEHADRIAEQYGLDVSFHVEGTPQPVVQDVQREIAYVFREAFNNITRHSWATKAEVVLCWTVSGLQVDISDNGVGFDPQSVDDQKHFGLGIMGERIASVGGVLNIRAENNRGTLVSICVPVNSQFRELSAERTHEYATLRS